MSDRPKRLEEDAATPDALLEDLRQLAQEPAPNIDYEAGLSALLVATGAAGAAAAASSATTAAASATSLSGGLTTGAGAAATVGPGGAATTAGAAAATTTAAAAATATTTAGGGAVLWLSIGVGAAIAAGGVAVTNLDGPDASQKAARMEAVQQAAPTTGLTTGPTTGPTAGRIEAEATADAETTEGAAKSEGTVALEEQTAPNIAIEPPSPRPRARRRRKRRATKPASAGTPMTPEQTALREETALLLQTRRALVRSPARALNLVREGQRRFPRGVLAQEREALAIEALSRLGRKATAQRRGEAFLRKHPSSPFADRIRELLDPS